MFALAPAVLRITFTCLLAFIFLGCSPSMLDSNGQPDPARLPTSSNPVLAKAGLIRISEVDRSIVTDLQYKGATTISKQPLYPQRFPAVLKPETAVRLKRANDLVKAHGMRILVWDAYRPPSAQDQLWHASGHNDTFVANPNNAPSQHSCGTAVDVTLVTASGKRVKMPTGFDSFSKEAASRYPHTDSEVKKNLSILQTAMRQAGFYPLPAEWWHYIDKNYKKYPETIPLSSLKGSY